MQTHTYQLDVYEICNVTELKTLGELCFLLWPTSIGRRAPMHEVAVADPDTGQAGSNVCSLRRHRGLKQDATHLRHLGAILSLKTARQILFAYAKEYRQAAGRAAKKSYRIGMGIFPFHFPPPGKCPGRMRLFCFNVLPVYYQPTFCQSETRRLCGFAACVAWTRQMRGAQQQQHRHQQPRAPNSPTRHLNFMLCPRQAAPRRAAPSGHYRHCETRILKYESSHTTGVIFGRPVA